MSLDEKISRAKELISKVLALYARPVVMSSFGKDSMVLLEIIKQTGRKFPVLFHREPFFPKKLSFANEVIEREEYTVYDYPPAMTSLIKQNGNTEIVNWYSVGRKFAYLPTGIRAPEEGKPFLCGYRDLYKKPLAPKFSFPWDVVLIGHKSSDKDPIYGDVPLQVDLKKNEGGPDYVFPLRSFSDDDVWEFSKCFSVAQNMQRYKDRGERADITFNNDFYSACIRCMDRDESATVLCPLINEQISNISAEIFYSPVERPGYIGGGV